MLLGALNLAIEDGKRWTSKEWERYLEVETLTPYYSFFPSVPSTPVQTSYILRLLLITHSAVCATGAAILTVIRECQQIVPCFTPWAFYPKCKLSDAIKTLTGELLQHCPPLAPHRTNLASAKRSSHTSNV